jgi:hypothetical protein
MINSKGIFYLIVLVIAGICCTNRQADIENTHNVKYERGEIYCWCFLNDPVEEKKLGLHGQEIRHCETPAAVRPSHLVSIVNLIDSVTDRIILNKLNSIIFERKDSTTSMSFNPDSRFLLLLRKEDRSADTVVLINSRTLYYGPNQMFFYSFNVLDSIRLALKKERIDCKD